MTPGDGFVVGSPGAEATVEVAHQAVPEGAEGLVVQGTGGAPCVVELAATGARAQRAAHWLAASESRRLRMKRAFTVWE